MNVAVRYARPDWLGGGIFYEFAENSARSSKMHIANLSPDATSLMEWLKPSMADGAVGLLVETARKGHTQSPLRTDPVERMQQLSRWWRGPESTV